MDDQYQIDYLIMKMRDFENLLEVCKQQVDHGMHRSALREAIRLVDPEWETEYERKET